MAINYFNRTVFDVSAQTLINTVNCVGVMGKGLALACKQRFPDMYEEYRQVCERGELSPGRLLLWKSHEQWVLNFPTKQHWRNPSEVEWIEDGLRVLAKHYNAMGITSINIPPLGCANGGLNFERDVKPLIERYLGDLPGLTVNVCCPH